MITVGISLSVVLFSVLIVSAFTELAHGKIYNWCTLPAIPVAFGLHLAAGGVSSPGQLDLMRSVLGCGAGVLIFIIPFLAGAIGGGDLKLAAAIGALSGTRFLMWALAYSALIGGVMALSVAIWHRRLAAETGSALRFLVTFRSPPREDRGEPLTIPFGLAMVIGTYWAWFMFLDPTFETFLPSA